MPLYASDVKIPADLSGAISGVGSPGYNAYNQINSNYGAARKKLKTDTSVRGMAGDPTANPNSYESQRLAATQGLDIGSLESALGGGLGDTAYKNRLGEREYDQNTQLADEIGALNKPDLLQQIFGGIGAVGGPIATYYGLRGLRGGKLGGPPKVASYPSSDVMDLG